MKRAHPRLLGVHMQRVNPLMHATALNQLLPKQLRIYHAKSWSNVSSGICREFLQSCSYDYTAAAAIGIEVLVIIHALVVAWRCTLLVTFCSWSYQLSWGVLFTERVVRMVVKFQPSMSDANICTSTSFLVSDTCHSKSIRKVQNSNPLKYFTTSWWCGWYWEWVFMCSTYCSKEYSVHSTKSFILCSK